jgi:hypothetical protein
MRGGHGWKVNRAVKNEVASARTTEPDENVAEIVTDWLPVDNPVSLSVIGTWNRWFATPGASIRFDTPPATDPILSTAETLDVVPVSYMPLHV